MPRGKTSHDKVRMTDARNVEKLVGSSGLRDVRYVRRWSWQCESVDAVERKDEDARRSSIALRADSATFGAVTSWSLSPRQTSSLERRTGDPFLLFPSGFMLPGAPEGIRSVTSCGTVKLQLAQISPCDRPYRHRWPGSLSLSEDFTKYGCFSIAGLDGRESMVVDVREKSKGSVMFVLVFCKVGGCDA